MSATPSLEAGRPGSPDEAFDRMLLPMLRTEFLGRYWGVEFVHVPGPKGRFEGLFSWSELSAIIAARPFDMERFKLYRDGKAIDSSRYVQFTSLGPRILTGSVLSLLAEGATLILDSVNAHSATVHQLAVACEEALGAETLVNVYAGWQGQPGFDLHWDWQEAIVLQVQGRKRWQVFKPTVAHPTRQDVGEVPRPNGPPVWEGVLEEGDLLYLPRGWWHMAVPLGEPSLHLTVTVVPPNGIDFLEWVVKDIGALVEARANAPMLGSPVERAEFTARLRERLLDRLSPVALDDFLAQWRSTLASAQDLTLPSIAKPDGAAAEVRLASLPRIVLVRDAGAAWFHAGGVRWECPAGLESAVESLSSREPSSLASLLGAASDEPSRRRLAALVGALKMAGVLVDG